MTPERDTIFALSSGRPPAAIAVIRVSGPRTADALQKLIGRLPRPRQATLARVRNPAGGEIIEVGSAAQQQRGIGDRPLEWPCETLDRPVLVGDAALLWEGRMP